MTHIVFDYKEGTIYMAVQNGELYFIEPIKWIYDNNVENLKKNSL